MIKKNKNNKITNNMINKEINKQIGKNYFQKNINYKI